MDSSSFAYLFYYTTERIYLRNLKGSHLGAGCFPESVNSVQGTETISQKKKKDEGFAFVSTGNKSFLQGKGKPKKTALSAIPAKWRGVPQSEDLGVPTPGYHQNFLPSRIEASEHCGPSSLSVLDQLLSRLPHVVQRGPQIIVLAGDQGIVSLTQLFWFYHAIA